MWNYGYEEEGVMNLRDSVKGIVRGQISSGLLIDLEIEEENFDDGRITVPAFGYWAGWVPVGTEVICSIRKWAKDHKRMEVRVDSVSYESDTAVAA